jgi:hypothetical protein
VIQIDAKGPQGNAWCIMATVSDILKQLDVGKAERTAIRERMMEGDYAHLCAVAKEVTNGLVEVVNLDHDFEEDECGED